MFKQKAYVNIVNTRIIHTRAHEAIVFITEHPMSEKYENNVLYNGTRLWNCVTVVERNIQSYESMKSYLKDQILILTIPAVQQPCNIVLSLLLNAFCIPFL